MPRTVYALLVGIDCYPEPIPPLRGCVNDIERIEALLTERLEKAKDYLQLQVLRNEAATRQAIIEGFRHHLSQAGKEDVALF